MLLPIIPKAGFAAFLPQERRLRFFNPHTDERLRVCYWDNGQYLDNELETVNHFFRDYRTNGVKDIDVRLLDLLYEISKKIPSGKPLHLISGYRSPATNRMLRARSKGVARHSLHMKGYAADIRIPGFKTAALRQIAVDLGVGGVGYYPKSDFVHVDIGRVRYW